jgi:hypothetical protein
VKLTDNHTVHHRADLESILMVMEVLHREDRVNGVMAQVVQYRLILALNEAPGKVLCLMVTLVSRTCLMAIQVGVLHLPNLSDIHSLHLATIHLLTDGHRMIHLRRIEEIVQEATRLRQNVREMTPWQDSFILHLMMMNQVLLGPIPLLSDQGNITFNTRLEELRRRVASTLVISRSDLHHQVVRILS